MTLKFNVRDKWSKPVLLQQAFVRVGSSSGDHETIFVAEPDNTKAYKVELVSLIFLLYKFMLVEQQLVIDE